MKWILCILLQVLVCSLYGAGGTDAIVSGVLDVGNLRCEYREDPVGIDVVRPRFSWIVVSDERGQYQTGYQVQVGSDVEELESGDADMWDTGKVNSDETIEVEYDGNELVSSEEYYWQVRVWDRDGGVSAWSEISKWSMGLLSEVDWQAEWIGYDIEGVPEPGPGFIKEASWIWSDEGANKGAAAGELYIRKEFELPGDLVVDKAVIWFTADDYVELSVNGRKLRSFRRVKDVNEVSLVDYLKAGRNILAFLAENQGEGYSPAGFIAGVRIESEKGEVMELVTGEDWKVASEERAGWKEEGYDDSGWERASGIGRYGVEPWEETKPKEKVLPPARYFRNDFEVADKPIRRATVYATSLGIYQLYMNGERIGEDYLSPGWTDFRKRVIYRGYDVTDMVGGAGNAIGAVVADGWYAGYVGGFYRRNHYGHKTRMLVQLEIEYADGARQVIASGAGWKGSLGPVMSADLLQGEKYDARKEMVGWARYGFDDTGWSSVAVGGTEVEPELCAAVTEPVKAVGEVWPVEVTEPVRGRYVFDMGQNFAGVVRIKVSGASEHEIRVRHGERLNADGTVYTANLRTAAATDVYICNGRETDKIWQPNFTYHGFQYVEVWGLSEEPGPDTVCGVVLSSDTSRAGSFECSDEVVNKLYSNIVWTQRMNFVDIPTDCPQRDERYGWTGDAQVYINTACYISDVQSFFRKWLADLGDAQREDGQYPRYAPLKVKPTDGGPAWADAGVICPWTIYEKYGDKRILEDRYDSMKRFVDFNLDRCMDGVLPPERYNCFGDWLNIDDETPNDVIFMAYLGYSVDLFAKIADVLGRGDDAANYRGAFERIKELFVAEYVEQDGRIEGDSQAGYVLAIVYDLLDDNKEKQAAGHLLRRIEECGGHLSTGFIGTKDLMLALAKIGRNDTAYKLLHNDTFPSWGYTIKNGASSIWERWDGWTEDDGFADPDMNSFAHYSFGAVGQWMFENIGGIKSDGSGFKNIQIKPVPGGKLRWAKTSYNSIRGEIVSNWSIEDGGFVLEVRIPANCEAEVYVPGEEAEGVLESGVRADKAEGVRFVRKVDGWLVYKVESGEYRFGSNR